MEEKIPKILFDREDHELLVIVDEVLNRDKSRGYIKNLLNPYLHPHGIKEMAASRELRIAYAVAHLLISLEVGEARERLSSLRALKDEVLFSAKTHLRINTARVLIQIMKKLVRSSGDYHTRLQLAHDFRMAASGKPKIIREQLRSHYLLEMPEKWNQIATDDHVHDVNTKGRKTPTHLIMDAWIKGIRRLKVIYYNYLSADAAAELLDAAEIMRITVRIGVEFTPRFRNRYIQLIWAPRGLFNTNDYLQFLQEPAVVELTEEGKKVSGNRKRYVLRVLEEFNARHINEIKRTYGFDIEPLSESDFLSFVGAGQVSILHLAEFIHTRMLPVMVARTDELRESYDEADDKAKTCIVQLVDEMNNLDSEAIAEKYLRPSSNPGIENPNVPQDGPDVPGLLCVSPKEMVKRLNLLHSACSITLGLSDMSIEDVIEILYDCSGLITHLENFNLKDYVTRRNHQYEQINELQRVINSGNVIALKRIIRNCIERLEISGYADKQDRHEKLTRILHDIDSFQSYYRGTLLKSRIGSDSAGRSHHLYGMGMVIKDTLPIRAQKEIESTGKDIRPRVPVHTGVYLRVNYMPKRIHNPVLASLYSLAGRIPGLRFVGKERLEIWEILRHSTRIGEPGNVFTLGGIDQEKTNGLSVKPQQKADGEKNISWRYLNSGLKNWIKMLVGFIPAFLTFYLTKDWCLLAYFGAFIWFGITGLRIIIQSVMGGGGISRSSLLKWNDYVSWERLTDSLLYTGFSVPLLDFLVKTVILDNMFGVTVSTGSILLYSVMAITNGVYISTHNAIRGFQKAVVFGNLFRTVLSIPIALAINILIGGILAIMGVAGVDQILQKWAAIISKTASDCVAGVIEGLADRHDNIRTRIRDYRSKLEQIFKSYTQMEILYPESDVLEMLESPENFIFMIQKDAAAYEDIFIINALDLLYFWMYQPRAQSALHRILKTMSDEERTIFVRSQSVLERNREISQLFIDGIVGRNFSSALAFYLGSSEEYLKTLKKMM
ncbi:MAG TPA: hypothetical protein ENN05_07825 [Deltaproteobacteria bacterium]|nr:hypothetical protein [Deltaproteobacteria bacterium]